MHNFFLSCQQTFASIFKYETTIKKHLGNLDKQEERTEVLTVHKLAIGSAPDPYSSKGIRKRSCYARLEEGVGDKVKT